MKVIKLCETEAIELNRVLDLPDGRVSICEREVHEFYRPEEAPTPQLVVISDAIDRTRTFIAKTREEFSELNSVMRELIAR